MIFFVLSRVTGLLREVTIADQFGASAEYDAYLAAFRMPDILFNWWQVAPLAAPLFLPFRNIGPRAVRIIRQDHAAQHGNSLVARSTWSC